MWSCCSHSTVKGEFCCLFSDNIQGLLSFSCSEISLVSCSLLLSVITWHTVKAFSMWTVQFVENSMHIMACITKHDVYPVNNKYISTYCEKMLPCCYATALNILCNGKNENVKSMLALNRHIFQSCCTMQT